MADDLSNELGQNIPLFEMIRTLRQELKASMAAARGDTDLQLELQAVELELHIAISRERTGTGKISFFVVDGGGELKHGTEQTHVIKLTLKPQSTSSGRILVGATDTDATE